MGIPITARRNTKGNPSPPASLPNHKIRLISGGKMDRGESAIEDDPIDEDVDDEEDSAFKQARMRRASEGHHLTKDGKKAAGGDLKCDKCGKGYKHSSCLTKHLHVSPSLVEYGRTIVNRFWQMGAYTRVVVNLKVTY